ncbi:MAG TPA: carbohydrate kinase family protein [Clostridia bacterium]|nr:carbohydrate kinase family protein [Clostridia bacterium]
MKGGAVFIGDVAKDEYYSMDAYPALGTKADVRQLPAMMGGSIANAACVYASFGENTRFLGHLNNRDRELTKYLSEQCGIDTGLTIYDDALADSKCLILLAEGEHTVFMVDTGENDLNLPEDTFRTLCEAPLIYTSHWVLGRIRCGTMNNVEVLRRWRECGVRVVMDIDVDMVNEARRPLMPYIDILFMNKVGFAAQSVGRGEAETVQDLFDSGVGFVVVTRAENGCNIYRREGALSIPGVKIDVVDVTGAGDTFCSAFSLMYQRTGDPLRAGIFANYAAALSVAALGARSGAVGASPVLAFMRERGEDTAPFAAALSAMLPK